MLRLTYSILIPHGGTVSLTTKKEIEQWILDNGLTTFEVVQFFSFSIWYFLDEDTAMAFKLAWT